MEEGKSTSLLKSNEKKGKRMSHQNCTLICLNKECQACAFIHSFIAFCVTFFFFFENAKIWVGRTTLNREKKGDGLSEAFAAHYLALNVPVTCRCTNSRPASSTENSHFESISSIPCLTFFMFIYEFFTPVHVELPSAQSTVQA